ncbi:uncharacterized protein RJT21DRAFT_132946 [Scheffersomyces amazonensis]|uniref:uncharacterized protein n=1 Tax=Scheffersomyces amazonensis TaxID=1078765 RepID=UPI00315D3DFC
MVMVMYMINQINQVDDAVSFVSGSSISPPVIENVENNILRFRKTNRNPTRLEFNETNDVNDNENIVTNEEDGPKVKSSESNWDKLFPTTIDDDINADNVSQTSTIFNSFTARKPKGPKFSVTDQTTPTIENSKKDDYLPTLQIPEGKKFSIMNTFGFNSNVKADDHNKKTETHENLSQSPFSSIKKAIMNNFQSNPDIPKLEKVEEVIKLGPHEKKRVSVNSILEFYESPASESAKFEDGVFSPKTHRHKLKDLEKLELVNLSNNQDTFRGRISKKRHDFSPRKYFRKMLYSQDDKLDNTSKFLKQSLDASKDTILIDEIEPEKYDLYQEITKSLNLYYTKGNLPEMTPESLYYIFKCVEKDAEMKRKRIENEIHDVIESREASTLNDLVKRVQLKIDAASKSYIAKQGNKYTQVNDKIIVEDGILKPNSNDKERNSSIEDDTIINDLIEGVNEDSNSGLKSNSIEGNENSTKAAKNSKYDSDSEESEKDFDHDSQIQYLSPLFSDKNYNQFLRISQESELDSGFFTAGVNN